VTGLGLVAGVGLRCGAGLALTGLGAVGRCLMGAFLVG